MASLIHLDTHVLAWLYVPELKRISTPAQTAIREGDIAVSPIALLELTYLEEIGRLRVDGPKIFASLERQLGLRIDDSVFADVVAAAHAQAWTRNPFDRLIAAQAIHSGAALITADEGLREHVPGSIW